MNSIEKIGFGGGCHWCTEAVFQHLKGVEKVEQGWIASNEDNATFSEAVLVQFHPEQIPLEVLVEIHLHTHNSTSLHSFREKYRSAVYTFSESQKEEICTIIETLQAQFKHRLITKVIPFVSFKASREQIVDYYKKNPQKPFCETFINPKLKLLLNQYNNYTKTKELQHLVAHNT
ncbi:MAG: peptide-methionine (S)-S-oxide reductase [Flavobacteriaceae bacterium]